ncbi:Glyoxylase, beta-lactamase superfamily II [Desulfosporosinus hippei DSM 8344]|uniref:Glyoxylase, beta-lactamase superfamily II n=1 Tax=Desulfosporosinus hippei DSM 8344 TaxID=1121419 RepID=A0A1G8FPU1_9FIRM|nr:Glyoxylase, beta-lactamase superfamily II [Desulfosporosinus hippei DSM 8344]
MCQEIRPNLFRIEIPLPKNPLKALNSYVIKGPERNLIIDTGMNREECLKAMQAGLIELSVNLNVTDFFITHLHADHLGLVANLASSTSKIYFNGPDAELIKFPSWEEEKHFAKIFGFPEDELEAAIAMHPGFKYGNTKKVDFEILKQDDVLSIGDYSFKCIETPGHSPGHMCLYDSSKKILVSGDHILSNITPNISLWGDDWDPLGVYLKSLDKVSILDVELVLPGHRALITSCRERIQELKLHHQERVDEILAILSRGNLNGYQVAAQMTWDMTYESWEMFPVTQKWFATGEAIAHLKYLEGKGKVRRETQQGKLVYTLAK